MGSAFQGDATEAVKAPSRTRRNKNKEKKRKETILKDSPKSDNHLGLLTSSKLSANKTDKDRSWTVVAGAAQMRKSFCDVEMTRLRASDPNKALRRSTYPLKVRRNFFLLLLLLLLLVVVHCALSSFLVVAPLSFACILHARGAKGMWRRRRWGCLLLFPIT